MNEKVEQAVVRLNRILPLTARAEALDKKQKKLYRSVLEGFYQLGRAPRVAELEPPFPDAGALLEVLAGLDLLTLDEQGEVLGCYPFTMEKRVHKISINGHVVHAMCALDALAPSAMFECASEVFSACAMTQAAVHICLNQQAIENADDVAAVHFGINWQAANACGSCADSLCTEMLFLINSEVANRWLAEDAENREIFTLEQAVEFSGAFFKPVMMAI